MQIRCDHCQAAYDVDPPAGSAAALVEMMFRCTECGRTFPISFGEPEVAASDPEPASAQPEVPEGLLLKQEGKVYHVQDMAKLQRWIAERRVLATDEVSRAGGEWQAVGQIDELSVFFSLLDQADNLSGDEDGGGVGIAAITGSTEQTEIVSAIPEPQPEPQPEPEPEPKEVSLPAVELNLPESPSPESELALDGIPDESELPEPTVADFGPDDPTMDLGDEAGDFFSEEVPLPDQSIFDAHTEEYHADDDPDFVWAKHRRRQTFMWWSVLFVLGTGIGWAVFDHLNQKDAKKTKTITLNPVDDDAAAPAKEPTAAAATQAAAEVPAAKEGADAVAAGSPPQEAVPPSTPDATEAKEAQAPEIIQKPVEKKEKDKKPSGRAENKKGWAAVDSKRWAKAKKHFDTALSAGGGTEARFGLAYVIEHQGQTARATGMYCKIAKTGRGEFKREAEGRLRKLRKTCP